MSKLNAFLALCGAVESVASVYYSSKCLDSQRNIVDENRHLNDLLTKAKEEIKRLESEVSTLKSDIEFAKSMGSKVR